MVIVRENNALLAWQESVRILLQQPRKEAFNLSVIIENPCLLDEAWLGHYNPSGIRAAADNISDVVNTIFPVKTWAKCALRTELYDSYKALHSRALRMGRHPGVWGTYFQRLIEFGPNGPNQLDRAIHKLITWNRRSCTGLVFHLSASHLDTPRTRGGPCWQFGELVWHRGDTLDLVVLYRNHDYFNKALGNFIGLGQLLEFICSQSNKAPGKLICHSVHAYYDVSNNEMRNLAQL